MTGAPDGRRVLVTGGSAGIGAATAQAVAAAGGRVVVLARGSDQVHAVPGELPGTVPAVVHVLTRPPGVTVVE